jgi:hypothetical protein
MNYVPWSATHVISGRISFAIMCDAGGDLSANLVRHLELAVVRATSG